MSETTESDTPAQDGLPLDAESEQINSSIKQAVDAHRAKRDGSNQLQQQAQVQPQADEQATPPVEEQALEEKEEKPDKLTKRFVELARRENENRRAREEMEQQRQEMKAKLEHYEKLEELKKRNPMKWAAEQGLPYSKHTELALQGEDEVEKELTRSEEVSALKQQLQRLEDERKQEREEKELHEQHTRLTEFSRQIETTVKADAKRWPRINKANAFDAVYGAIARHAQQTKQVLEVDKVADKIESDLKELAKVLTLEEMNSMINGSPMPAPNGQPSSVYGKPRTIHSAMSSVPSKPTEAMTRVERLKLAAQAIKFHQD